MKIARWFLFFAALGGYFLWPYHTARKLGNAIKQQDTETIKKMIDASALVDSMNDAVIEGVVANKARSGATAEVVRARMIRQAERPGFKERVERTLTPDALATWLATSQPSATGNASVFKNEKWNSPIEFSVQDASGARAIFKFRGVGWKMCGIELSKSQIDNFVPRMQAR